MSIKMEDNRQCCLILYVNSILVDKDEVEGSYFNFGLGLICKKPSANDLMWS